MTLEMFGQRTGTVGGQLKEAMQEAESVTEKYDAMFASEGFFEVRTTGGLRKQ